MDTQNLVPALPAPPRIINFKLRRHVFEKMDHHIRPMSGDHAITDQPVPIVQQARRPILQLGDPERTSSGRKSMRPYSLRPQRKQYDLPNEPITPKPRASILGFWQRRRQSFHSQRERSPMMSKNEESKSVACTENTHLKIEEDTISLERGTQESLSIDDSSEYIIPPTGLNIIRCGSSTENVLTHSRQLSRVDSDLLTSETSSSSLLSSDDLRRDFDVSRLNGDVCELSGQVCTTTKIWSTQLRNSFNRAQRRCRLLVGQTLFNQNPEEGLTYLIGNGLISSEPSAIARFLLYQPELSRQAIGDYFGLVNNPLAERVLKEFLQSIDMVNIEIDEALRTMLRYFHPPGESQKISHLMKAFQLAYRAQNTARVETIFQDVETVEVLAYSTLMLQTDLHNPNLRRLGYHMTINEFVENNRGIDGGDDVSQELLRGIYHRVSATPFMTLPDPVDRLRQLDRVLVGPLKTTNLIQRHRRFMGWVLCQELDRIPTRGGFRLLMGTQRHWRRVLLFNDILLVVKPMTLSTSGRRATLTTVTNNSSSLSLAAPEASKEPFSVEPPTTGTYQVRMVIPLKEVELLVFESKYVKFGVRFCNSQGPLLNLSLTSTSARRKLIEWVHLSTAELHDLDVYFKHGRSPQVNR